MSPDGRRGAVFVVPTVTVGKVGPVAPWVPAIGWATATRHLVGPTWLLTPNGVLTPDEAARAMAVRSSGDRRPGSPDARRSWVPASAVLAAKDVREAGRAMRLRRQAHRGPWDGAPLRFVWQRHELFHRAGFAIARRAGAPLVLFVDAPVVWEARRWGVDRPWGGALERVAERPSLRDADVVACVSTEVADAALGVGAAEDRIVITPNGVDLDRFAADDVAAARVRTDLGLEGRLVVGWAGSFRRFHGLVDLLEAVAVVQQRHDVALLLVGDGQERADVEKRAADLGLRTVRFTGTVPHDDVAAHLAAMDVAVLAAGASGFHYSPLKLREYLAAGRPVVAARIGEVTDLLHDGDDALLYEPGDSTGLAAALDRMLGDATLRARLGRAARTTAESSSWEEPVRRVLDRLP